MGLIRSYWFRLCRVRDSQYNDLAIQQGDIIGLMDGEIRLKGQDVAQVVIELLKEMAAGEAEISTLFYGADASEGEAQQLAEQVRRQFPNLEVEVHNGGQPLYYYILALE
ncbi:hypothetical protein SY88_06880 [Clostridiales bacterium PH28_bin88]|nr:hypothetical protein SY88_06880 [Clostridiales bacterium PH28_bin88]